MRAHLVFLVAAFEADLATDGAPTFDPADGNDVVLLDEYMADALPEDRRLYYVVNGTNYTDDGQEVPGQGPPLGMMALVAAGGAAIIGALLCRGTHTYETHDYDHAASSGLLDHPDYEVHYDDGASDGFYE
jgi:hypothetical protein